MMRARVVSGGLVAFLLLVLGPSAWAQQTLSGLAGVVKDAAGMPVAGATVEAASPALIERVRSVVTDGSGQYKITDLQPGAYTVTVKAPGFSTLTQTGVDLPAAFVGIDESAASDEKGGHSRLRIGLQRMDLARRLIDEGPLARHPIMLQITPGPFEHERMHGTGVIMAFEATTGPDTQ